MRQLQTFTHDAMLLFSLMGVLFIPFSFGLSGMQARVTKFLFQDLILYIASQFEALRVVNPEITSDSTSLYLLALILLCMAILLALVLSFLPVWKNYRTRMLRSMQLVLAFYLSIVMLKYGFDKIFKAQFYLPEPNTLYTPMGMLDRDILYWSVMGTSYGYSVFMGLFEVIPALLLLFSKTRNLGLFILAGVLLNVVGVNFGFDISVKVYSCFLLLMTLVLLAPSMCSILHFFVMNQHAAMPQIDGNLVDLNVLRISLKTSVLFMFFTEAIVPHIQDGHFNGDKAPRNHLHGAYGLFHFENQQATHSPVGIWPKRMFIHRHGYLIFQYENDTMEDFYMEINPTQLILTNYKGESFTVNYMYSTSQKTLELAFVETGTSLRFVALPWKDLPLLKPLFHWTVDGID